MRLRLNTSDVPELLLRPLSSLPTNLATSVLTSRKAWIDAGLDEKMATSRALDLITRLSGQRLGAVKRLQGNPASRAAARHERQMRDIFLSATHVAQDVIPVQSLEDYLTRGDVPWHLLEPALQRLEGALNG